MSEIPPRQGPAPLLGRLLPRRKGASTVDYAVLAGLVAVAVLGAVVLTGDRVRSLFVASEETVGEGVAALPPAPGGGGGAGGPPPPPGAGAWSGDGVFALTPGTTPQSRAFLLTNVGAGPLSPGVPALSGPGAGAFQILSTDCGPALPPGESCEVVVEAAAGANGLAEATLAAAGVTGGIALSRAASGFDPALAWIGDLAFVLDGTPGAGPLPRTQSRVLTLSNQGAAEATGISPALGGPGAGAFSLTTDCPTVLPAGASCAVTIVASADADGAAEATLAAGGPASAEAALSATAAGFAPALAWSGTASFVLDGTPGPEPLPRTTGRTFLLTNAGTAPATGLSVGVSGAGFAAGLPATTCTTTLAAGASCTFAVEASASADGAFAGLLSSGGAAPALLPLSATASGFAPAWAFDAASAAFSITDPPTLPATETRTFTLTNVGTLAGNAPADALSGPDAGSFVRTGGTCAGQTLAPAESCSVEITFSTTSAALRTATLAAGPTSVALTGTATGAVPSGLWSGVSSFSIDAPTNVATTQWQERDLVFTNTSAAALTGVAGRALVGASGAGGTFAVQAAGTTCVASGGTLAAGASCTVRVRYTGAANGTAAATLRLTAAGGIQIDRALSGTTSGWGPVLQLSGYAAHAIPASPVPTAATFSDRVVTITNAGPAAITGGLARAVTGAGYTIATHSCGVGNLASGGNCTVTIRYTAGDRGDGTFAGNLEVLSTGLPSANLALSATVAGFVAPSWTTAAALPAGTAGAAYSVNLAATDANGDLATVPAATRFQVVAGALPPGLGLSVAGANSFATLGGTLGATSAGSYAFTVRATDATGLSAERTFTMSVPAWTVSNAGAVFLGFVGAASDYNANFTFVNRTTAAASYPGYTSITPTPPFTTSSVGWAGVFIVSISGCTGSVAPGGSCVLSVRTRITNPGCGEGYVSQHRLAPAVAGLGTVDGPQIVLSGGTCDPPPWEGPDGGE